MGEVIDKKKKVYVPITDEEFDMAYKKTVKKVLRWPKWMRDMFIRCEESTYMKEKD